MFFEELERRELLAVLTWRNPADAMDVNADGSRTSVDALIAINDLLTAGSRDLSQVGPTQPFFVDTSGDGFLSPIDALLVINVLVAQQTGLLQEASTVAAERPFTISLGQPAGTRTYRLGLDPTFDPTTTAAADRINVYLLDPEDPKLTLLDRGVPGTPVFSLTSAGAETVAGLSSWDGSELTIDLTRAPGDTGILLVQVVGSDAATGTTVDIHPLSNVTDELGLPPLFVPQLPVPPGYDLNLDGAQSLPGLVPQVANVRFNSASGLYEADVSVINFGPAVESSVALAFGGLPAGVTLANASGTTGDGRPYVNLAPGSPGTTLAGGGFGFTLPVRLQFDDPAALRVPLQMEALGQFAMGLFIDPIPPLVVSPGRHLEIPLTAGGGTPGLPLTFTVDLLNSPGGLPTGKIEGQGKLIFEPTNGEIGSYFFDVLVSNGKETARQTVMLNVVPDAPTSTRLSGVVRDFNNVPLAGVPVSVGTVSTVTAADGSFVLDDPALDDVTWIDELVVAASALGPQYVDLTLPIEGLMDFEGGAVPGLQLGEQNDLAREVFVPVLNLAAGVTVVPGQPTFVTTPDFPGASLFLPAGSLLNPDDTPYTGTIYLTPVPAGRTELVQDPFRSTGLVVRVDASQPLKFASVGTLTIPNLDGFKPGDDDLSFRRPRGFDALLPATAGPLPPGSGGDISTPFFDTLGELGPTRDSFASTIKARDPKDKKNEVGCPPLPESCPAASEIELHSGNFLETHSLPSYQSQGQARGITLAYNSEWADPRPIVHQAFRNEQPPDFYAFDPAKVRLMASLEAEVVNPSGGVFVIQSPGANGGGAKLRGGENAWRFAAGDTDLALQLDLRGLPTGLYAMDGSEGVRSLGAEGWIGDAFGLDGFETLIHVNETRSPFGAGWGIAGLQKIVPLQSGDLLLVDGGGEEIVFDFDPGENRIISPQGDFTLLEILADGYRRLWPNQSEDRFDSAGRLTSSTDRNGNATQYQYDAGGQLVKIIDPVGLETTLLYSAGNLTQIVDPAGRTTRFTYDAVGNLVEILNPDQSLRRFSYDEHHRMIRHVDERLGLSDVLYGPGGRASGEIIPAYGGAGTIDTISVNNLQERNLVQFTSGSTRDLANSPFAGTDIGNFVTWTGQGRQETRLIDEFAKLAAGSLASPVTAFDAVGELPRVTAYNHHLLPRTMSDSSTTYHYGLNGNLIVSQDAEDFVPGQVSSMLAAGGTVTIDGVAALDNLPLTIEAWVHVGFRGNFDISHEENLITTNADPFVPFGDEPYGYGFGLSLARLPDGTPFSNFSIATPGGGSRNIRNFAQIGDGDPLLVLPEEWRHIAVVYTPGQVESYLDGQLIDIYTFTQGTDPVGNQLTLGKGFTSFVDANLDEVRVWNVARTEEDIQRDLAHALAGNEPGLVHYFPFDKPGVDPDLADHGPGGATATITGSVPGDAATPLAGTRYTYDSAFQQVTSITDGNGHRTYFDIDPATGDTLAVRRVVGAFGGPDDLVSTFTYLPSGLIDTMTDPLGRVTNFDYDARQRLIAVTLAQGTLDEGVWQFEYDDVGNVTAEIDPLGHRTESTFDIMDRLTRLTQPDPDGPGPLSSPVSQMFYNVAGDLTRSIDPLQRATKMGYDVRGAISSVTDSDNKTTTYERNAAGNVTRMTDPLGHETQYAYDARQRLTDSIDPDDGSTKFEYDPLDNKLTAITDPSNNKTRYFYDSRNRLIERRDPLNGSEFYSYDFVDNLAEYTDRLGRATAFAYDDLDRLLTETWIGGGNAFNYAYDKAGNLLSVNDAFTAQSMTYDDRDRLVMVDYDQTPVLADVTLAYAYDAAGNRLSTLATGLPGLLVANVYAYDALNRITSIIQVGDAVSDKRVDVAYNPLGQFASIARFNDSLGTQLVASTAYTYDQKHRLKGLTHKNAANAVLNFETLAYDAADRITQIANVDGTTSYTYDDRSQLTGANHSDAANPDETYAYDANGNRTASSRHGSGYQTGANNRLLSDGTFNYTYDNEGNLLQRTEIATGKVRDFTWDFRNRLVSISDKLSAGGAETQRVEFLYDPFNRRIGKAVIADGNTEVTFFVYDGADVLFDFVDPDGAGLLPAALDQTYLHGPAVDQVFAQDDGTEINWLLADHLGTITDLVDNSGAVVNHLKYDSYGNPISQTNPAEATRYSFTGREFDAETGLFYYRARYYDAGIGRFLSEDPIGFGGLDANLYRYGTNDPVMNADPSGYQAAAVCSAKKDRQKEVEERIKELREGLKFILKEMEKGSIRGVLRDDIFWHLINEANAIKDRIRNLEAGRPENVSESQDAANKLNQLTPEQIKALEQQMKKLTEETERRRWVDMALRQAEEEARRRRK